MAAPVRVSSIEPGNAALRVLITRPAAEAQALAQQLEARGHEALVEPLLTIEPLAVSLELDAVQAVALTSANAAPALAAARHLPVFAVGDASAAAARLAGCTRIETADGDAPSLARRIVTSCRPADGAILHVCGTEVRPGLAEPLIAAGFDVRRQAVYRAVAVPALSAQARAAVREGIDAVLMFSPRTAGIFAALVVHHGLGRCLRGTAACCLSAAVAEACRELAWGRVGIAARRDQAAMVELLEGAGRRC
jgi:uroporphyrinogen-III synthase